MSAAQFNKLAAGQYVKFRDRLGDLSVTVATEPETAIARALREAQERAERSGRPVPMPVFTSPPECPESDQDGS